MKKALLSLYCLFVSFVSFSQVNSKEYSELINNGFSLYSKKDYKNAAIAFSAAINLVGNNVDINIRRAEAFCWALANYPDSAFHQLSIISNIETLSYPEYVNMASDNDFSSFHNDQRWKNILRKTFTKAQNNFHQQYLLHFAAGILYQHGPGGYRT